MKRSLFLSVGGMHTTVYRSRSLIFVVGHFAGSTFVSMNARLFLSSEVEVASFAFLKD